MLIVMSHNASDDNIDAVVRKIQECGHVARPIPGGQRVAIGVLYNTGAVDSSIFYSMEGVKEVIRVTCPYKLVSREFKPHDTVVSVGDVKIGGDNLVIIAGPCSIESEEQALTIARAVKKDGAQIFRGEHSNPGLRLMPFREWARMD